MTKPQHIVLIITGSIAAYKALDLIRDYGRAGITVDVVLTASAQHFVTPLTVSALSGRHVYSDIFNVDDESSMGHIALARNADAIVVAPCSADFIAKMAHGIASDLASTIILAACTDTPVIVAPAMNPSMWQHAAVQRNVKQLQRDGVTCINPDEGLMACGETGAGRFPDNDHIIQATIGAHDKPLAGKHAIVTLGATIEPIDAVRYISNHSSGKQGTALSLALAHAGASVTAIAGNINAPLPAHPNITTVNVTSAVSMLQAVQRHFPADLFIATAAVADWHIDTPATNKQKKSNSNTSLTLTFTQTPDILAHVAQHATLRPPLVIGFAAETDNIIAYAQKKREQKQCDWICANDVSDGKVFGKNTTNMYFIDQTSQENWGECTKEYVANKITQKIIAFLA